MNEPRLSPRERQILDAIFAAGELCATEVWEQIPEPPPRTAVRTMLRTLEQKGHLQHRKQGREFVYFPVRAREEAGQSALASVLKVFFDNSLEKAVATHFADPDATPDDEELKRLAKLIREARRNRG